MENQLYAFVDFLNGCALLTLRATHVTLVHLLIMFIGVTALSVSSVALARSDERPAAAVDHIADKLADTFLADRCRAGLSLATTMRGQVHFYNYGIASRQTGQGPTSDSKSQEGYVLLSNDSCEGSESALRNIAQQLHAVRR